MYAIRVLIVEDSPWIAQLFQTWLEEAPRGIFSVELAFNAQQAKDVIASHPPFDLILLDLALPDSRGQDSVVGLREAAPDTFVLIISGYLYDLDQQAVKADRMIRGQLQKCDIQASDFYVAVYAALMPPEEDSQDARKAEARLQRPMRALFSEKLRREGRLWRRIMAPQTRAERRVLGSIVAIVCCVLMLFGVGVAYGDSMEAFAKIERLHSQEMTLLRDEMALLKWAGATIIGALVTAVSFLFRSLQQAHRDRVDALNQQMATREEEVRQITGALSDNTSSNRDVAEQLKALSAAWLPPGGEGE